MINIIKRSFSTKCWMEVSREGTKLGKMTFKMYEKECPKTVLNFKSIITGSNKNNLLYKGVKFHRIVTDFMVQGGDVLNGDGTGSISIYGKSFPDENNKLKLDKRGVLAMANSGRDQNGSQFFITLKPCPWLDGMHVVFGQLVEGEHVLELLHLGGSTSGKTTSDFVISDCGIEAPSTE